MNELKRFELIVKQDLSESIIVEEKEGKINVDCSDFTGTIDLDKILLDNFDDNKFLTNSTFVLGDNTELIAEYQHINVTFGSNCQIYIDTENEFEHEKEIKIIGVDNNIVKVGKNVIITLNNENEIYSSDNCKIIVDDYNFIEIIEDVGKSHLEEMVNIVAKDNSYIILPPIKDHENNENNITVGVNSTICPKGYYINFK